MSAFRWTTPREQAAQRVAEDRLTDDAIAVEVGVARRTLAAWKSVPEFQERVRDLVADYREAVRARGIAVVENRLGALQQRWELLEQVRRERAAEMGDEAPGGGTGLLVRKFKTLGSGAAAETVREYAVDTGMLREIRELEEQAARELQQRTSKTELTGAAGGPVQVGLRFEEALAEVRRLAVLPLEEDDGEAGDCPGAIGL